MADKPNYKKKLSDYSGGFFFVRGTLEKARSKVNLEQQDLQNNFLNRYSDEQIMRLLNDTASIDFQPQNDYDFLKTDMQTDLALSSAKVRLFEREHGNHTEPESAPKTNKKQPKELDATTIQKINDNQYS